MTLPNSERTVDGGVVARPVNLERERQLGTPRSMLEDYTRFGIDPGATWRPAADLEPHQYATLILAHWQHLAASAVREHFKKRSLTGVATMLNARLVEYGLAADSASGAEHLNRLLSGSMAAPVEQLINWALALEDVAVLPSLDSIDEIFPPGSVDLDAEPEPLKSSAQALLEALDQTTTARRRRK